MKGTTNIFSRFRKQSRKEDYAVADSFVKCCKWTENPCCPAFFSFSFLFKHAIRWLATL